MNGRPFRDPFLVRAAEAGYRSAIHPGDRPSLLSLTSRSRPSDVDVNVHPAKLEVRFRDRIGVERVVEEAVRARAGRAGRGGAASGRVAADAGQGRRGSRAQRRARRRSSSARSVRAVRTPRRVARPPSDRSRRRASRAPVLQLFDTYIVYEAPEGVVIVDQHSAHERVLYEAGHGAAAAAAARRRSGCCCRSRSS